MPITVNTNATAASASMHLSKNSEALRKSLTRLSSGSRIVQPVDDAGGLAVSMKLESAITRLTGAQTNIQNGISFLEVQDGVLEAAGKIVNRMIELKGLSQDVLKNSSDIDNYNREFQDLQVQLKDMTAVKFNGVSLFAQYSDSSSGSVEGVFDNISRDNTLSIFVSAEGSQGPKVSIAKSMLLSALTIDAGTMKSSVFSVGTTGGTSGNVVTFAADNVNDAIKLNEVSVGVFTQALQNIATLRADNGASMSRLRFSSDNVATTKTNMEAANGRIVDVDIASESTRMAKYNVLVQASASMLAQANTQSDIALMLIR